jgi:hypothetical protein
VTRHRVLWGVQIVLALIFGSVGGVKISLPIEELIRLFPWVSAAPPVFVRLLGAAELAASVGLVLPMAIGVLPWLTRLTASALAVVMALAAALHTVRGEWSIVPVPVIVGACTLAVALGRRASPSVNEP